VVAASVDPVSQRPSQRGAFIGELVDGILDEVGCRRVNAAKPKYQASTS
jgi:hypothetical protein